MTTKRNYPHAHTVPQVDDYHGTQVADPYRWLEDPDSPETRAWIASQNQLTEGYLDQIPYRKKMVDRLTTLWDFPKQLAPVKRGGRYFQQRNTGLQNQYVLFVMDSATDEGQVLLDPNTLSEDGTTALNTWAVSPDGKWLAYATADSGSDWITWSVRNVETGEDLPDRLVWSKFSEASWLKDSSGFYYSRYAAPEEGQDYTGANYFHKVFLHRIGTDQAEDTLVYERPDQKEWGFNAEVSDDGRYLVLYCWQGTDVRNRLYYQDMEAGGEIVPLIDELEAAYTFVGNDGPVFYLFTNLDAARGKLIAVDTSQPDRTGWRTLVGEQQETLEAVRMVNNEFIMTYLKDAHHQLVRYDLAGNFLGEIPLPTLGAVPAGTLQGRRKDAELFFNFWSFLVPLSVYRFDFNDGERSQIFSPLLPFDPEPFITRQVFATSQDGTAIPVFLTHRKDLELNGKNPTLLYGYGGFNISLTPTFAPDRIAWFERGGVLAWANLRGGGEYGEEWHQAGMIHTKQNVFDDFIACGEYLIEEKVTSAKNLGILGRSNGGLLVGACMVQRPDLFGAAIPVVGVLDMLRFQKFTIGWAWVSDYGSSDKPDEFETLMAYSPYHNLKPGTAYPPTLVVTGDHDDRVVPGHSFKFAAALQAAQAGEDPTLIRIQVKTGHGMGKPTRLVIEEAADIWTFLMHHLGMK
jgi:prolyl oligopeptidase